MSIRLASRPRLPLSNTQAIFSRGVRLPRKTVGDDVNVWLKGPGSAFKYPTNGPNWLSKNKTFPFPMNTSFKPPAPISDKTKTHLYELYMRDPKRYNIRVLSETYGISIKRLDAILRLKGMEASWVKEGKQLQTGFVAGMEKILGSVDLVQKHVPASRQNVYAADLQDQEEVDNRARDRYQRLYWEPVGESEEPIIPRQLELAKEEAKVAHLEAAEAKSDAKLLTGRTPKNGEVKLPREPDVVYRSKDGRPSIVFKDVGGRFVDIGDRLRRTHEAEHRKQARHDARPSSS